jgi:hypothetical protein
VLSVSECTVATSRGPTGCRARGLSLSTHQPLASTFRVRIAAGKILTRDKEEDRVVGVVDDVPEETVEGGTGFQIYYRRCSKGRQARNW